MKLKHTLVWLFFVIALIPEIYAQRGFSVGYSGAYLQSFRRLKNAYGGAYTDQDIENRDSLESSLGSVQFAVDGIWQYQSNLTLSFGAGYSNIGYQYENTKSGTSSNLPNLDHADIRLRFFRLSLPIMLGYKLNLGAGSRHALLFRIGFNNHIVLHTKAITVSHFKDGSKEKEEREVIDYTFPYNLSVCANIGYYYKMNRHSVGVNLVGDYGVTSISAWGAYIRDLPYSYGIGLSYFYALHK